MTNNTLASSISIPHIAKLAKIPLTADETEYFEKSFGPVIEYMQKIGKLDMHGVAETTRTGEEENVLREDIVTASFTQEEALQNAKHKHAGYFLVDAVLEKRE